jgi:hypothetical protein
MSSSCALGTLVLLVLPAGPAGVGALCDGVKKQEVRVTVLTILATECDDKVDRCVECIAREVRKKYPRLKGFHRGPMTRKPVVVGQKDTFDLVAGQVAVVTVRHGADDNNRVELKVAPPQMGEITYETCCGKFFPIVTHFRTNRNDLLIIAVRVQPCHGNK